ncbi:DUF58 domain-containing protein [Actinokineospora cianjurensis]|uniref:Uncharacterized protein DUF58 n=1 Tax=Actinokineospora cianjurensis TaxID=585224 RepID=A0A421AVF1_9PSEU|nr:DUF58 domain-containing protein [Actinokineospora cianjurensis]RLK53592.1 uncharacterized protein DUF58 [Actinokineospora cianjurensis]
MTRRGWVMVVTGVVLVTAGVLADYPELVVIGLAALAAVGMAAVWMIRGARLSVRRTDLPDRVAEGTPVPGRLTVRNEGARRSLPLVVTDVVAGTAVHVALPSLSGGEEHHADYVIPALPRGVHRVPPLVVGQSDPLRLMRRDHVLGQEWHLRAYPRWVPITPPPTGGPRDLEGPTSSSSPQGGVAFHSLRAYQPGDDWRLVHWRSTARAGQLLVRHNVIPDEPRHLVVLDTDPRAYVDDAFESAVRVAASLCVSASRAGQPVELRSTDPMCPCEPVDTWSANEIVGLDRLATVFPAAPRPFAELVDDIASSDRGVVLTIVTGSGGARAAEASAVRAAFLLCCLVEIGRSRSAPVEGVVQVTATDVHDFAANWTVLVGR